MPRTLILCPTYDHVDTLFASVASVQAQRDRDWELVVICDGAPERSAEILAAIGQTDPRVSHRVFPKGERLGEAYRDAVIRDSTAEFVCHLGDDDLWSDRHLDTMTGLLRDADFALQGTLELGTGGTWAWSFANSGLPLAQRLAEPPDRIMLVAGLNNFAVRRDAYLRLERGWSPAPPQYGSDVYMCTQYLRDPRMRIASSAETTFAKLPSRLERHDFTPERRLVELTPVLARINLPGYLRGARDKAVIGMPVMRALHLAGAAAAEDLADAMAMIGIEISPADGMPDTALRGDMMRVPLTSAQSDQCEMAWRMLRLPRATDDTGRLAAIANGGHAFLLSPYLEALGQYDPDASLVIAEAVGRELRQPEIATAYRLRTLILMDRLAEARQLIDLAERRWPMAGWLDTMRAWYQDRATKSASRGDHGAGIS